jgi:hypothetical protein
VLLGQSPLAALHQSFHDDRSCRRATPSSPHRCPVPSVSPCLPPLARQVALTSSVLLPPPSPHLVPGSAASHRATIGAPGMVTMPGRVPEPWRVAGPTRPPWHRPGLARLRPIRPCWVPRGIGRRTPWATDSGQYRPVHCSPIFRFVFHIKIFRK